MIDNIDEIVQERIDAWQTGPLSGEKFVAIPLEEYKELLVLKGRYLELIKGG